MNDWIPVTERMPEELAIVETKITDEHGTWEQQKLYRRKGKWCRLEDFGKVKYQPTHWRECE